MAAELGLPVRMRLVSYAFVGVEPEVMGIGPVPAAEKALRQAGLSIDDIEFPETKAYVQKVLGAQADYRRIYPHQLGLE